MTEAKHTPGPWERARDGTSVQDVARTRTICKLNAHGNRSIADGDLVIAAPDMLKALEVYDAYERYDVPPPFGHECQWCGDCVQKMNDMRRAAIAKATGAA